MFIAIEGNMASGKTTYAKILSKHFRSQCVLEPGEKELLPLYPYLKKHPLRVQIYCLIHRLNSQKVINTCRHKEGAISDYVMAKDLVYAKIFLSKDDYVAYTGLFNSLNCSFEIPDLLIILNAPLDFLLERIRLRALEYEMSMKKNRLKKMQKELQERVLTVPARKIISLDATKYDILNNHESAKRLIAKIDELLY